MGNYPAVRPTIDGSQLTDQWKLFMNGAANFWRKEEGATYLIRWGVFNTGTWWYKQPDGDTHTDIWQNVLNSLRS